MSENETVSILRESVMNIFLLRGQVSFLVEESLWKSTVVRNGVCYLRISSSVITPHGELFRSHYTIGVFTKRILLSKTRECWGSLSMIKCMRMSTPLPFKSLNKFQFTLVIYRPDRFVVMIVDMMT